MVTINNPNNLRLAVSVILRYASGLYLGVSRKDDPNAWGLPGGKIDPEDDGDPVTAVLRELKEETGLIGTREYLKYVYQGTSAGDVGYHVITFVLYDYTGEINTMEAGRVGWVTVQQLLDGPFGEYNRQAFTKIGLLSPDAA